MAWFSMVFHWRFGWFSRFFLGHFFPLVWCLPFYVLILFYGFVWVFYGFWSSILVFQFVSSSVVFGTFRYMVLPPAIDQLRIPKTSTRSSRREMKRGNRESVEKQRLRKCLWGLKPRRLLRRCRSKSQRIGQRRWG